MIRPKQFARIGEFHLEESILDVLLEARHKGKCLGAAAISRHAGIFRDGGSKIKKPDAPESMNDAIATGMLIKLMKQDQVERCPQKPGKKRDGWKLTESEYERRRDDIKLG